MAAPHTSLPTKRKVPARSPHGPVQSQKPAFVHASVLDEARRAGLLEGEKTEHVSFRVPPALLEAAKREAGVSSTSELGVLAGHAGRPRSGRRVFPAHGGAARTRPRS